jgi:hypothetical protein
MKRFRTVLAWICCALLPALGLPRSPAPCDAKAAATATGAGPGCCGSAPCCCQGVEPMHDCGCGQPKRAPEQQLPSPRQPLPDPRAGQQPLLQPTPPPPPDRARPQRAAARPTTSPLPHRPRQQVLSVWRL